MQGYIVSIAAGGGGVVLLALAAVAVGIAVARFVDDWLGRGG